MDKKPYYKRFFKNIFTWKVFFESIMLLAMFIAMEVMERHGMSAVLSWCMVMSIYIPTAVFFSKFD
jgi:hypothetical protein